MNAVYGRSYRSSIDDLRTTQTAMSSMRVLLVLVLLCAGCNASSLQHVDGIPYTEFVPSAGSGPVVLVLSGASGPVHYEFIAEDLVKLGYYVVLSDGRLFYNGAPQSDQNLRKLILRAQSSPHARQGKVAVIGLSRGGAAVLVHASAMPELVAVAISYYPVTTGVPDREELVRRWKVPTLAFVGEADVYIGSLSPTACCLVGAIRAMATRAKELGTPFELHVYPGAGHAFNLIYFASYNSAAAEDAWKRTVAALQHYLTDTATPN